MVGCLWWFAWWVHVLPILLSELNCTPFAKPQMEAGESTLGLKRSAHRSTAICAPLCGSPRIVKSPVELCVQQCAQAIQFWKLGAHPIPSHLKQKCS